MGNEVEKKTLTGKVPSQSRIDRTLTKEGCAADAKTTGEAIGAIVERAENAIKLMEGRLSKKFAEGCSHQYDLFWDAYQQNGELTNYTYAFAGSGWNKEIYIPKYAVIPTIAKGMYVYSELEEVKDANFSLVEYMENVFFGCKKLHTVIISVDSTIAFESTFYKCSKLKNLTIQNIPLLATYNVYTFHGCYELENLNLTGEIGNDISFSKSLKLSKKSIENVFKVLSQDTSGKACTLSKKAVNKAFETGVGKNDGSTSNEWFNLVASRDKWTIALV